MIARLSRRRWLAAVGIILFICLGAGCQHDPWAAGFLTHQPQERDLVDRYRVDSQTLARDISISTGKVFIDRNSEIVLSGDHQAQFLRIPEISPTAALSCLVDGSGSWALGRNDPYFVVDVHIQRNGVRGSADCREQMYYKQLMIYGKNAPYKLHLTILDPDSGDALQFEKTN
jgi:hypothetical protein